MFTQSVGIEYGLMQLIAEVYQVLKHAAKMSEEAIAEVVVTNLR